MRPREVGSLRIDPNKGFNGCVVQATRDTRPLKHATIEKGPMMTRFLFLFCVIGAPASAHVGHLGEMAGHDHWVAGIALGAALGVSLWGALKGKTDKAEDQAEAETDEEEETA